MSKVPPASAPGPASQTTPGFTVRREQARVVIEGTGANDDIRIAQNKNGDLVVSDGQGRSTVIPADQLRFGLVVRAGDGNDRVIAAEGVTHDLVIDGGAGDDELQGGAGKDEIRGGSGRNLLRGGAGDDYLEGGDSVDTIEGGAGCDVIYGLGGDDRLQGGTQRDYIDGGAGNDFIAGDAGDDMLIGGTGADVLEGGAGDDVLAGSSGRDRYHGGRGADVIYQQAGDTAKLDPAEGDRAENVVIDAKAGSRIKVIGSKAFQERVQSDFEAWRSLPDTAGLLTELDQVARQKHAARQVTVGEKNGIADSSKATSSSSDSNRNPDHSRGPGANVTVDYKPSERDLGTRAPWNFTPPSVVLYHELAHADDMTHGDVPYNNTRNNGRIGYTGPDENHELKAIGRPFDHDATPATPLEPPSRFNENLIRARLGLPPREHH
jgi:Ca2+-binding RTX toxin-like protein